MKKKKGALLVEVETGTESLTVVTNYENLEADQLVIFAPEGSEVNGKPFRRAKVAGEWNEGVICGPAEMGWPGDASSAIILDAAHEVGAKAPANSAGAGAAGAAKARGAAPKKAAAAKADSSSEDEKPQAKGGKKGGAGGFAAMMDSDDEDDDDDEDSDSDDRKAKAKAKEKPADKG